MKCEENGGCPFYRVPDMCNVGGNNFPCEVKWELAYKRCHLTSIDFPFIKAMLAGEWKCGTCGTTHLNNPNPCPCSIDFPDSRPCGFWQPREETR